MAVVTAAKYERATNGKRNTSFVQFFGTSASATDITIVAPIVASITTRPHRLVSVSVKYSGASSTTITVTKNYLGLGGGAGTSYDVLLNSSALSAQTDYVYIPAEEVWLNGGDTITVLAPAVTAVTAAVVIEMEVA